MIDKFDYYEILGILVPGTLLAYWTPICFPQLDELLANDFSSEIDLVAFVALAVFVGHVTQAFASAIERPVLFRLWGGTPSDRALDSGLGDRYLTADAAARIRRKLSNAFGSGASDRSLFLSAMQLANAAPNSRSQTFNGLYAFHRALLIVVLVALILLLTSTEWGAAEDWSREWIFVVLIGLLTLFMMIWYRTHQRANYYVREVLQVAERVLDQETRRTGTNVAETTQ